MLSSSRFVVAVHVLSLLAHYGKKGPVCSATIAKSVDTNPVVIRRLMSQLEAARLVTSASGRTGGFLLARTASDISLADIYQAVEDEQVFRMHKPGEDAECDFAKSIMRTLKPKLADASKAMTVALGTTRLGDIVDSYPAAAVA
ncbi:MAG: Rrf2 family transcriptional regulator [Alphaproteobacteria bacterium]|nr:Rrf2 family transcriptional regulator [Alphaproteobacteria bacterium]